MKLSLSKPDADNRLSSGDPSNVLLQLSPPSVYPVADTSFGETNMTWEQIAVWVLPASFVVGGLLVGIIFHYLILKRLLKIVGDTRWRWDDIIFEALGKVPILWFLCAGAFFAVYSVPLDPEVRDISEKLIIAVILLSATFVLARMATGLTGLISEGTKVGLGSASLISNMSRVVIYLIGFFIILQNLGISITPLIGALGIGGLAAALAFQDTLSNLFAGFQIIISRQVRPGDHIMLDSGETGYVTDVKWRNTTIKDFTDNMIIIPNNKLAGAIVTNYNLPRKSLWAEVHVGVHYDSDLEHVERVASEVAYDTYKDVIGEELRVPPKIHFLEFADSSINLRVRINVKQFGDRINLQHNYIKHLHKRFNEEGIEIPFPIRTVYMKGEE